MDKELFYDLCNKYNVEVSDKYNKPMIKDDGEIKELTQESIKTIIKGGVCMNIEKSDFDELFYSIIDEKYEVESQEIIKGESFTSCVDVVEIDKIAEIFDNFMEKYSLK